MQYLCGVLLKRAIGILLLLASHPLFAQPGKQVIRGIVTDADSQWPLQGVVVTLPGHAGAKAAETDEKGLFRIEGLDPGRYTVRAAMLGYTLWEQQNLILNSGKEMVLEIKLAEKVIEAQAVVITSQREEGRANNDMVTVSGRSFDRESTSKYAGSRGDPSRMAANFAGVSSGNDARNDIVVRGNSSLGLLWRLEGADIPNPNHFSAQGATGGPISILNNNLLSSSDFLTGAFPAEYGNRMSAVFDLRLRPGNNEKREYTGQVGINGFEFGMEGPIAKKGGASYLINYRYSTLQAFDLLGIRFGVSGVPQYQDLSFKVHVPLGERNVIQAWGIGGTSVIELLDSEKGEQDWEFSGAGTDLYYGSNMFATGLTWNHFFNARTSSKTTVAFSGSGFSARADTLSESGAGFTTFDNVSNDRSLQVQYQINSKLNTRHTIRSGLSLYGFGLDYYNTLYSQKFLRVIELFDVKGQTASHRAFFQWQYRPDGRLTLNTGLNYQGLWLNGSQSIEPRAGLKFALNEKHQLGFATGLHSQLHPFVFYFVGTYDTISRQSIQTNRDLNFMRGTHAVISYDWRPVEQVSLRSEVYYQYLFNVPVNGNSRDVYSILNAARDIGNLDLEDSLANSGTGFNYGWEITAEKFFSKNYYSLVTISLFQSRYRGSDEVLRNTAFNNNYVINALSGYEKKINTKLSVGIDLRFTHTGGARYIPVDLIASRMINRQVEDPSRAFEPRTRDYQRFDLKVNARINGKKASHSLFISIENILKRKNVLRQYYDPRLQGIRTEYQFGIFPLGGYRIEF